MSETSLRRSYERRKSAGARLQSPDPGGAEKAQCSARTPKMRRVKSALETRREHESSTEVFPHVTEKAKIDPSWGRTRYREDFGPKTPLSQVSPRPSSPTRRNNPHPAESFLIWRQPVRIHKHKKAVQPHPDSWMFINEGFYDDYMDQHNTGDAKNEVVTNVAKIPFPGAKKNTSSVPQLTMAVSGTKAQLHANPKHNGVDAQVNPSIKPPSPKSRMIHHTLKGSTLPVFKEWIKTASPVERDVVIEMLKSAHNDSEEKRLQKVVADVLQPESIQRVQGWLQNATAQERQIVLHVMETLAVAAGDCSTHLSLPHKSHYHYYHHHRAQSYPITLRHRSALHRHSESHYSSGGQYSRHFGAGRSAKMGKHSLLTTSRSGTGDESIKDVDMSLIVKKMNLKEDKTRQTRDSASEELWHHRIKKKTVGTTNINRGAVYNQPQKDKGQHFAIHPEWPIA